MVELAMEMYIIARDFMNQIINTNFGSGKLAILGGIQINTPGEYSEFLPLSFEVHQ